MSYLYATPSYVRHDPFVCAICVLDAFQICHICIHSDHTYEWVMSHIWRSHVTYMNESCHIHVECLSDMSHLYINPNVTSKASGSCHNRFPWKKMLNPRNPPNSETQISRYKFKLSQNLALNLYRKILLNLSFSIEWIWGIQHFQCKLSYHLWERVECVSIYVISVWQPQWFENKIGIRKKRIQIWHGYNTYVIPVFWTPMSRLYADWMAYLYANVTYIYQYIIKQLD